MGLMKTLSTKRATGSRLTPEERAYIRWLERDPNDDEEEFEHQFELSFADGDEDDE